jgi:hypothetical protein
MPDDDATSLTPPPPPAPALPATGGVGSDGGDGGDTRLGPGPVTTGGAPGPDGRTRLAGQASGETRLASQSPDDTRLASTDGAARAGSATGRWPDASAPTMGATSAAHLPHGAGAPGGGATGTVTGLTPGQTFGHRYHIISLLGVGGMGAVYHVWDVELAMAVALKVSRPDTDPTTARELERRFKRELVLARQVTHANVIRIHDLGEIEGVKFITMPFVQGTDLARLLAAEGRLPVPRALSIARQIASGLWAAHEGGVVHRDLKPANILIDQHEHAQNH